MRGGIRSLSTLMLAWSSWPCGQDAGILPASNGIRVCSVRGESPTRTAGKPNSGFCCRRHCIIGHFRALDVDAYSLSLCKGEKSVGGGVCGDGDGICGRRRRACDISLEDVAGMPWQESGFEACVCVVLAPVGRGRELTAWRSGRVCSPDRGLGM
ncbi:hypothetical protein LX36DRAFT_104326 [Colletotrichum falcatum]|nr:hypothetical protein LX36DRAFT_104326 [Colletotrichum falcatum]